MLDICIQKSRTMNELVLQLLLFLPVKVIPLSCYSYDILVPEIAEDVGGLIKAT